MKKTGRAHVRPGAHILWLLLAPNDLIPGRALGRFWAEALGDHIGDYYRAYSGDTRGLDYSSYKPYTLPRGLRSRI